MDIEVINLTTALLVLAGILIIFALLLFLSPGTILKVEQYASRVYTIDEQIFRHRYVFGFLLIAAAFFMIYTYFTY